MLVEFSGICVARFVFVRFILWSTIAVIGGSVTVTKNRMGSKVSRSITVGILVD